MSSATATLIATRTLIGINFHFFVHFWVCLYKIPTSRDLRYRYESLKQGIYTDKFLIHSYEFNSSALLFPATSSSPPLTFSLLNIQEGCTLNKGC